MEVLKSKNTKLITVILFSFLFLSLTGGSVQAGLVPCGLKSDDISQPGDQTKPCQFCHLFVLFKNIVDFFIIYIVPPIAILMIAISGFMFISAYLELIPQGGEGGPSLISKAKNVIIYTIIGLAIIYGSWLAVNFFFQIIGINDVNEFKGLPQNWWKINCPIDSSS